MYFDKLLSRLDWAAVKSCVRFLSFAFLLAILWGTLSPADPVPRYFWWQDKLEHLVCFAALGTVLSLAIMRRGFWFALGITWTLAVGVEYGQALFTMHREFSWRDATASGLGGFFGAGAGSALNFFVQDMQARSGLPLAVQAAPRRPQEGR